MLALVFSLGETRYAVDSHKVLEVVPVAHLKAVPKAPPYVAGLLNYRGVVVPVIDLCQLAGGAPCRRVLSSRILLVKYRGSASEHTLGVMAESVTDTVHVEEESLADSGIHIDEAAYLGRLAVATDDASMLQLVEVDELIPSDVRDALFRRDGDANPGSPAAVES